MDKMKYGERIPGKTYNDETIDRRLAEMGLNWSEVCDKFGVQSGFLASLRRDHKNNKYSKASRTVSEKMMKFFNVSAEDLLMDIPEAREYEEAEEAEEGVKEITNLSIYRKLEFLDFYITTQYEAISEMFHRIEGALNEENIKRIIKESFSEL